MTLVDQPTRHCSELTPGAPKEGAEMRSKFAGIVAAGLVSGLAWFWIARDTPHGLPEAGNATGTGTERQEQLADSKRALSSRKPSPPNPSRGRTAPEPEGAWSPSPSRGTEVALERRESARRARAVDAGDRGGAVDDSEAARGSENIARIKQLLEALRDGSRETPGGDPIEPDAADLSPEDVDRLDLDGDREISPWEQERARRLLQRAEHHPVRYDLGDGAYPVERGDYGRQEWEFDAVDTNQDDLMDADEFYTFLIETERISLFLDTDGDRHISRDESGLSQQDFAPLDIDDSGSLKAWEIRRAVALGILD
jgi:hypothetical protein